MATFPLFIAPLNHALTMLLWPIFAALFYSPRFLNETPFAVFCFFCVVFFCVLFFTSYWSLRVYHCIGIRVINQIRWDKRVKPCLVWRNVPRKCCYLKTKYLQNTYFHLFSDLVHSTTVFYFYCGFYKNMNCLCERGSYLELVGPRD